MKSMFQPWLARLRARPAPAAARSPAEINTVIEDALRDAGLLQPAGRDAPTAVNDGDVIEGAFQVVENREGGTSTRPQPAPGKSDDGSFGAGRLAVGGDARRYRLFVPSGHGDRRLPLVVMLHGCTQDPEDFARGTRMNPLAQDSGALVLYPAQTTRANRSRCWNWFQPGDQRRDAGEPALLAAMTRHVIATQAVDPRRVHVAGLSAGGAMAAILGREYPELFASIGVHSGLPAGAAHDVPSAFAAMRKASTHGPARPATPLIVFHGDHDRTVDPRNGEHLLGTEGHRSIGGGVAGRRYTRTVVTGADGRVRAEHWLVHGAGHAWSGGSSAGSHADPLGPDASREMLRFFAEHPLD